MTATPVSDRPMIANTPSDADLNTKSYNTIPAGRTKTIDAQNDALE